MAYFPAFVKLNDKKILIIGGGYIAHEKLQHLLDFSSDIHVVAQGYSQEMLHLIHEHSLSYQEKSYTAGDIEGFDVIIIAVDDLSLQAEIFEESRNFRCLCNAVDSVEYCDFIFPSYIKKGDLTIAISTSGASPALAKQLRIHLQKLIPESITGFLMEMKALRKALPKGQQRMHLLEEKAKAYIKKLND
ncbi:bifunctional precorrin-2 dehydrogenase/sirohydrochlorin ferrochelatase [Campylobacterota bacterium]